MGNGGDAVLTNTRKARYPDVVARTLAATRGASDPVRAAVEAAVDLAETDRRGAVEALWKLQGDWKTLARLEERLGGESAQATFNVGAAIHLARTELASPAPQLRRRVPELMAWLRRTG